MGKPLRNKTKFAIWAGLSFLTAIGLLAQGHPGLSGVMVLVGFCFVFFAGTSRS